MMKAQKNYGQKWKRCCLETGARTASRLQPENLNLYVAPMCTTGFIFPIAFTNPGVIVEKADGYQVAGCFYLH